jgi:hypothetical protein
MAEGKERTWVAVAAAVLAVAAVVAPMFRSPAPDSFPLSTYPMFARDRGDDTWVDTVIGRTAEGEVVRLSPMAISGSDEPVLASATVSRALNAGLSESLCRRVAAEVGPPVVRLEVVSERHDLDRFTPDEPLERRIHDDCPVAR